MSSVLYVPQRERWAARSMIVRRWIAKNTFKPRDPICEIETDGVVTVYHESHLHPEDIGAIYWYFVAEGNEIGLGGRLLEFSSTVRTGSDQLHQSARRPLIRRGEYPRFFLSYRRDDAEAYAGRLQERLSSAFGEVDVFMDQFSIQPGEVFAWTIQQAVVHAGAVIVLIGPRWLDAVGKNGQRRLDDEHDYVRREITAALDRGTLVVPILAPGGTIPDRTALPDEMRGLLDLQFLELTVRHWRTDVNELMEHLTQYFRKVLHDHIG